MTITHLENNCALVALNQLKPEIPEEKLIRICRAEGYDEEHGMFILHILTAAAALNIKLRHIQHKRTLHQTLELVKNDVALIQVTGHILVANRGIPIDPNIEHRRSRRRVLGLYVCDNATTRPRRSWANSDDPAFYFVKDVRLDTQRNSYKRRVYEEVFKILPLGTATHLASLRPCGYTRKMLKRHYERGDVELC